MSTICALVFIQAVDINVHPTDMNVHPTMYLTAEVLMRFIGFSTAFITIV